MTGVLWLHKFNLSQKQKYTLEEIARKATLNPAQFFYVCPQKQLGSVWEKRGKSTFKLDESKRNDYQNIVRAYISKINPKIIVINDAVALGYLTNQTSLNLCRGSVYRFEGIPCIVFDDIQQIWAEAYKRWLFRQDFLKLRRWYHDDRYSEPRFNYRVCISRDDLLDLKHVAGTCILISEDIETSGGKISVVGFSLLDAGGRINSYVVPFINPLKEGCCHWDTVEDEVFAWKIIREINANDIPKTFQNGGYDAAFFIKYRIPLNNYILDSLHLWHSIWAEAPKKLNFISSCLLDFCRYWKDEIKGDKKAQDKADRIPTTAHGYRLYLRYNALDCYNTLLNTVALVRLVAKTPWALENYDREFRLQIGPVTQMTMTGIRRDFNAHYQMSQELWNKYEESLRILRIMVDDEEFNPNSGDQFASLIYDVLGAQPIKTRGKKKKGERSIDKTLLLTVQTQHPLYAKYIQQVWDTKEARNNHSSYPSR